MYDFKACLAARYLQTEDVKLEAAPENCKNGCCFGLTTLWAGRHFTQKNEGPEARIKAITTRIEGTLYLSPRTQAAQGLPLETVEYCVPAIAGRRWSVVQYCVPTTPVRPGGRKHAAYTAAARATASAPAGSRMGQAGSVAARHTASATSRE